MGKQQAAHIVWDWNGTLFHDNDAIIGATYNPDEIADAARERRVKRRPITRH